MKKANFKAYCFDVFGTVVDWRNSVAREVGVFMQRHGLRHIDPHDFADTWRSLYQPAMEACRTGQRPYVRLDVLHAENLAASFDHYGIATDAFSASELADLNRAWHRLDAWPDAAEGLRRLKTQAIIAPASNGNIAIMVALARRNGLPWDAILGSEVTRAYKPAPEAYTRMAETLDLDPSAICMVAAHNNDLRAARSCGLGTAFVPRPTEHGPEQRSNLAPEEDWDLLATDFCDLARQARG